LLTFSALDSVPSSVQSVLYAPLDNAVAESVADAVVEANAQNSYSHVLCAGTKFGSNHLGRVGALLNASPVSDVVEIMSDDTFLRPLYAGNALAKVTSTDAVKLLSIRPTSFDKAAPDTPSPPPTSLSVAPSALASFVSASVSDSTSRPDLASAPIVISGGRGMKSSDNFALLETLADKLGGAVGASRAAVDAGFAPNDLQVGQTGKVVAPDLYVAVGISGAIQHLSGMKDSKVIVAINKDGEAPIFQVADYGLVGDLFDVVPELTEKV
jgi:electron transfer flavoprotein alpha subunit